MRSRIRRSRLASSTSLRSPVSRYLRPPCTSRLDRELVPDPKSCCSTSTVRSPRMAASRATPAPVMPPPMTSRSAGWAVSCSSVARTEDRLP